MLESIISILLNYTEVPAEQITGDTELISELGINSLDMMNMINEVEEKYEIEVAMEYIQNIHCPIDIVKYIESQV